MTNYIVLVIDPDEGSWTALSTESASSPRQAIEKAIANEENHVEPEGLFVATPARSWNPVKVAPKTGLSFS